MDVSGYCLTEDMGETVVVPVFLKKGNAPLGASDSEVASILKHVPDKCACLRSEGRSLLH